MAGLSLSAISRPAPPLWIALRRAARRERAKRAQTGGPVPNWMELSTTRARPQKILIVTDAWAPQVNGVVRTLEHLAATLSAMGHEIRTITPDSFRTWPLPTYPEIRLALFPARKVARLIEAFAPDAIHIATEGTLGLAARRYCVRNGIQFSTAFHTRYPDYVHARFRVPHSWVWSFLRWFHKPAVSVMAPTEAMRAELEAQGIARACVWSRGVDLALFGGERVDDLPWPKPIWLSVGRLAVEKNLEAFLSLDLPGTKLVVGDGPQAAALRSRYKTAIFTGAKFGADLARLYAGSDVFVFPSKTDTFGLVILEALASGTPVAAYPVQGPRDVLGTSPAGVMDDDLGAACRRALAIPAELCREHARRFTWDAAARQFLNHLAIPDFDPELDVSPAWRDAEALPGGQSLKAAS